MKAVSGTLKIGLAQYRDMEAFAMFASDLDATSRRQLDRGARLVELLRQPQYSPYPVEEQVISVWGGTTGKFDEVPVSEVLRFEQEFLAYLRHNTRILQTIAETGLFDDDTAKATEDAVVAFREQYVATDGRPLATADDQTEAIAESELDHEQIVVGRKQS
jgi:F-type H+-transporting ATPase subunit alpha